MRLGPLPHRVISGAGPRPQAAHACLTAAQPAMAGATRAASRCGMVVRPRSRDMFSRPRSRRDSRYAIPICRPPGPHGFYTAYVTSWPCHRSHAVPDVSEVPSQFVWGSPHPQAADELMQRSFMYGRPRFLPNPGRDYGRDCPRDRRLPRSRSARARSGCLYLECRRDAFTARAVERHALGHLTRASMAREAPRVKVIGSPRSTCYAAARLPPPSDTSASRPQVKRPGGMSLRRSGRGRADGD